MKITNSQFSKKIKSNNISESEDESDSNSDSNDSNKPVLKRNPKRKCRRVY